MNTNKPFTKPFWKLLGISVLSLLFLYGGIVWAVTKGDVCTEYTKSGQTRVGSDVADIGDGWSTSRFICKRVVKGGADHNIDINTATRSGKQLRLANNSGVDYFVPTKTDTELNAFLAAKGSLNVEACEVGLLASDSNRAFGSGVPGCDDCVEGLPSYTFAIIDGVSVPGCGDGNGICSYTIVNECLSGASTGFSSNATHYLWQCQGADGGTTADCSKSILDIVHGGWTSWGACTGTCGSTGSATRSRTCTNPTPENGGNSCSGLSSESCFRQCDSSGSKLICGELYRQGLLSEKLWVADNDYANKYINPNTVSLYQSWARPLVKLMEKSNIATQIVRPYGIAWAEHMAYLEEAIETDNFLGKSLQQLFLPIHDFLAGTKSIGNEKTSNPKITFSSIVLLIAVFTLIITLTLIVLAPVVFVIGYCIKKKPGVKKIGKFYLWIGGVFLITLLLQFLL